MFSVFFLRGSFKCMSPEYLSVCLWKLLKVYFEGTCSGEASLGALDLGGGHAGLSFKKGAEIVDILKAA